MSTEARTRLAARQAELVAALMGRGEVPAGFDAERLDVAVAALANKRRRAVAHVWPTLIEALGDGFAERFQDYAATNPLPAMGGPLADGRAFIRWLAKAEDLPEACRLQMLAVDLRYALTARGLVPRRWPALKAIRLYHPRRMIAALRVPWLGERWLSIPF